MVDIKIATDPSTKVEAGRRKNAPSPRTQQEAARAHREQQVQAAMANLGGEHSVPAPAQRPQQQAQPAPQGQGQGDVSFGAAAMGELGYGGAIQQARMIDGAKRTVRSANPMHGATKEYIDTGREVNSQRQEAAETAYAAEYGAARARADGMDLLAERQEEAADRAIAREARNERRRVDVESRLGEYERAMSSALDDMDKLQKLDPSKVYQDKSAGQKARIFFASLGRGLAGRDPSDVLRNIIQQEADAQRQNRETATIKYDAAKQGYQSSMSMRDTYLALSQDERTADAMTELSLYKHAQGQLEAAVAQYGAESLGAQHAQALLTVQEEVAKRTHDLAAMEASNPRHFTRQVSTMGAEERRARRALGDEMVASGGEAFKQGVGAQRDMAKMGVEAQMRAQERHADATDVGPDGLTKEDREQIARYSNNAEVAEAEGVVRQLDDLIGDSDIEGVGTLTTDKFGSSARTFEGKLRAVREAFGRAQSGGVIGVEEAEEFDRMLMDGVAWGGGEERLRKNVKAVRKIFDSKLETYRRNLSPAAEERITGAPAQERNPEFWQRVGSIKSEFE